MRTAVQHETYGTIVYEESIWTGKKSLYLKGVNFKKIGKKKFEGLIEDRIVPAELVGNVMTGVKLIVEGESIQIIPKPAWYVVFFSIFIFAFNIAWGNSPALCTIFPIVGGAIGGGVSALFAIGNVFWANRVKNVGLKIVIGLGCLLGMLVVCFLLASVFIAMLYGV